MHPVPKLQARQNAARVHAHPHAHPSQCILAYLNAGIDSSLSQAVTGRVDRKVYQALQQQYKNFSTALAHRLPAFLVLDKLVTVLSARERGSDASSSGSGIDEFDGITLDLSDEEGHRSDHCGSAWYHTVTSRRTRDG